MRQGLSVGVALLLAGIVAAGLHNSASAAGKRAAVPLPDPNPKREVHRKTPPQAQKVVAVKKAKTFNAAATLKPLLDFKLSKSDRAALKEAITASYKHRYPVARAQIKRIKHPVAKKLARWYYFRSSGVDAKAADIEAFRLANPQWPDGDRLRRNAERALYLHRVKPAAVKAFFAKSRPQTGAGKAALAAMHLKAGAKDRAKALIAEAWRNHDLSKDLEKAILKQFSGLLDHADHKARVDRLLYQDRKSKIAAVSRTAVLLPPNEQKKIKARVAVVQRSKTAKKLLAAIPKEQRKGDVGFYFSRIQWLRRHKEEKKAWTQLRDAPSEPDVLLDLDEWWIERRINCRAALNGGYPEVAYSIARDHGPLSGKYYAEAEFLAGWIALQFLEDHEAAEKHFLALRTSARTPKLIARGEYWLGRAAEAAGRPVEAAQHFTAASDHAFTYYGQLARQSLPRNSAFLPIVPAPEPTPAEIKSFRSLDAVKAIAVIRAAGLTTLTRLFFLQLARTLEKPGEAVLLAELAILMGQPHSSVRLGLIAFNRGHPTGEYAFPVGLLPKYKKLTKPVEDAFLHALSRQESEFNPKAKSPVGARGLMQLMPRTALMVARQHKIRYKKSKLTQNPSYNMMLGVAHLRDLMDSYKGSYVLSLTAYNAGGGRVKDWTKQFGDPRDPNVDTIDWVERVPFTETRNYIQKILLTMQIFRSRLEGPENALRLLQDLNRYDLPEEAAADTDPVNATAQN